MRRRWTRRLRRRGRPQRNPSTALTPTPLPSPWERGLERVSGGRRGSGRAIVGLTQIDSPSSRFTRGKAHGGDISSYSPRDGGRGSGRTPGWVLDGADSFTAAA